MTKLIPIRIGNDHFEVDARGWICPLPKYVFEALLPKLETGTRIDLLVDCPGAITDIPKDASRSGYDTTVIQIGDGEWSIAIRERRAVSAPRT